MKKLITILSSLLGLTTAAFAAGPTASATTTIKISTAESLTIAFGAPFYTLSTSPTPILLTGSFNTVPGNYHTLEVETGFATTTALTSGSLNIPTSSINYSDAQGSGTCTNNETFANSLGGTPGAVCTSEVAILGSSTFESGYTGTGNLTSGSGTFSYSISLSLASTPVPGSYTGTFTALAGLF